MADGNHASPAKRTGRPSIYSQQTADEIISRLSKGEPLAQICRSPNMPAVRTVSLWKENYPEFNADFARAREEGFDAIAADCLAIADDASGDVILTGREGEERETLNSEFVQRAKLRIETRLKLLAKWDPRRYGDKVAMVGADGGALQIEQKRTLDINLFSPEEREAFRSLLEVAKARQLAAQSGQVIEGDYSVRDEE